MKHCHPESRKHCHPESMQHCHPESLKHCHPESMKHCHPERSAAEPKDLRLLLLLFLPFLFVIPEGDLLLYLPLPLFFLFVIPEGDLPLPLPLFFLFVFPKGICFLSYSASRAEIVLRRTIPGERQALGEKCWKQLSFSSLQLR